MRNHGRCDPYQVVGMNGMFWAVNRDVGAAIMFAFNPPRDDGPDLGVLSAMMLIMLRSDNFE